MKNIFKIFIAFLAISLVTEVKAQQDPMYTQYMFNMMSVNPGYAGSRGTLNAMALIRQQWIGFDGAPRTQTFSIHSPILSKNIGLGLSIINDKVGPISQTMSFIDFAYHMKINKKARLAMGLKAGVNSMRNSLNELNISQMGDDAFASEIANKFMPNFGFGLYYYTKKYYVGLSTPKLVENKIEGSNDVTTTSIGNEKRHYFFVAGLAKKINRDLVFKPTALIKKVKGAPTSIDLSANVLYREWLWLGVAHRFGDSFSAIAQVQLIENLWLGYAYDYTITELTRFNTGSHEVMLSYDFRFARYKIKSPRYF